MSPIGFRGIYSIMPTFTSSFSCGARKAGRKSISQCLPYKIYTTKFWSRQTFLETVQPQTHLLWGTQAEHNSRPEG